MSTTYTKEQKKEYFSKLRQEWQENKEKAEKDDNAKEQYQAILKEAGGNISYYSFYFTLQEMQRQGLEGTPYIDAKTFKGWREAGFSVKKGEKSTIHGITWIEIGNEDDKDDGFLLPKRYALFHRSQVEGL